LTKESYKEHRNANNVVPVTAAFTKSTIHNPIDKSTNKKTEIITIHLAKPTSTTSGNW
jgi:hypothetical protein